MVAVVITGPPGAGKSSVLTALSDALSDDDIAHATVEVEALVWAHPPLSDEQWTRHVRLACELYRDADYALLLVAQTLETDGDVAQLLAAIGPGDVFLVRLEARPDTLVERIVAREPASWSGLSALVDHAHELAASMPALAGVDLVLATDDQRPEDLAARVREAHAALAAPGAGQTASRSGPTWVRPRRLRRWLPPSPGPQRLEGPRRRPRARAHRWVAPLDGPAADGRRRHRRPRRR